MDFVFTPHLLIVISVRRNQFCFHEMHQLEWGAEEKNEIRKHDERVQRTFYNKKNFFNSMKSLKQLRTHWSQLKQYGWNWLMRRSFPKKKMET